MVRAVAEVRAANTACHFQEIALANDLRGGFDRLAEQACQRSTELIGGRLAVDVCLFDFDGTILGRARVPAADGQGQPAGGPASDLSSEQSS
jgi:hypothetical protein